MKEATQKAGNWIRQRSRWLKGWMQTWLVHNRHPIQHIRQLGLLPWLGVQLLIGVRCLIFLAHPLMWLIFLVWLIWGKGGGVGSLEQGTLTAAVLAFIVGNILGVVSNMLPAIGKKRLAFLPYAFTNLVYWWMHTTAANLGLWQLFTKPFYWEKTEHELSETA